MPVRPGRPRRASRQLLQEAAFELFPLRGYRRTSVELIARTAGFSRATFFNFFSSKAELFWVETDELMAELFAHLDAEMTAGAPPELARALGGFAEGLSAERIPWALQNVELIEAEADLVASGASRVLALQRAFARYIDRVEPSAGAEARAAVMVAALLAALLDWIGAGVGRASLDAHLRSALASGGVRLH